MNNEKPVTVIVPTYNRPDYLERLLISMESNRDFIEEVIIVNDHSTNAEEYLKVIERFKQVYSLVYIYNEKNMGAPYCRNIGIKLSKTKYLAFTDDDDEWLPNKLELQLKKMQADIGLVYTWALSIDESGKQGYKYDSLYSGSDITNLLKSNFIPSSSVLANKAAIVKAGGFDLKMVSCQDWDMWLRVMKKGYKIDVVPKELLIYHLHKSASIGKSTKAKKGYRRFYKKHFLCYIHYFIKNSSFRAYIMDGIRRRVNGKLFRKNNR